MTFSIAARETKSGMFGLASPSIAAGGRIVTQVLQQAELKPLINAPLQV
jgi:hypothetical protein